MIATAPSRTTGGMPASSCLFVPLRVGRTRAPGHPGTPARTQSGGSAPPHSSPTKTTLYLAAQERPCLGRLCPPFVDELGVKVVRVLVAVHAPHTGATRMLAPSGIVRVLSFITSYIYIYYRVLLVSPLWVAAMMHLAR